MVCFRYIIVNTLYNCDNKDNNNNNNNNNNNIIFTDQSALKMLCSVHHLRISFALVFQSNKAYLCQTISHARKMIPVNMRLLYSNIKVKVTCKLQSAHVERRVCPIGFSWRVHKRLLNRHDKTIGLG